MYVFGVGLNQCILTAVRRRSDVETSLTMQGVSELIENITTYLQEEADEMEDTSNKQLEEVDDFPADEPFVVEELRVLVHE